MAIPLALNRLRTIAVALASVAATMLALAMGATPAKAGEVWSIEVADDGYGASAGISASTSLAIDSNGRAHICYGTEFTNWSGLEGELTMDVRYANNVDGNWSISKIDSSYFGFTSDSTDVYVGASGFVRLCYVTPEGVNYTSQDSDGWLNQRIPDSGLNNDGGTATMGFDSHGSMQLFFCGDRFFGLKHAEDNFYELEVTSLFDSYYVGYPDLALDQHDFFHLSFTYIENLGDLMQVGYYSLGKFTPLGNGSDSAIVVDDAGSVHIVYTVPEITYNVPEVRVVPGKLMYIVRVDGTWQEPIELGEGDFYDPCLAIDNQSRIHLAYVQSTDEADTLVHSVLDGSEWVSSVVVQAQSEEEWAYILSPSLALDANGTPYVSYWVGGAPYGCDGGLYLATFVESAGERSSGLSESQKDIVLAAVVAAAIGVALVAAAWRMKVSPFRR